MRKGGVVFGVKQVIEYIQTSQPTCVFLANDTGENTKKKIYDKCHSYHIDYNDTYDASALSKAIGKENVKVVAIKDRSLLKALK